MNVRDLPLSDADLILRDWRGKSVRCTGIERLHGGKCSAVFALSFDTPPYKAVVKLADHSFAYEIAGLEYLREQTRMRVPEVYWHKHADELLGSEILLLERLPGINLEQARMSHAERQYIDEQLADILVELHSHQRDTYGSVSEEEQYSQWVDWFAPNIESWFEEANPHLTRRSIEIIPHLLHNMPQILQEAGVPTLVHGDIWDANIIAAEEGGRWVVTGMVDPDARYANVEYELAYLEVFDTVSDAFFRRYWQSCPMREGYQLRRLYYWLNTLLLHVVCFGGEHHVTRVESVVETLEKAI